MARLKRTKASSAGGIVVRRIDGVPQFVAGKRRRDADVFTWTLPKGTPLPDESQEETALREVAEETGLSVRIVEPFESISYSFVQSGTRVSKTVFYYLMEATGGDLANHDHEFEEVRWFNLADAGGILTFESERALIDRAADRVARRDTPALASPSAG